MGDVLQFSSGTGAARNTKACSVTVSFLLGSLLSGSSQELSRTYTQEIPAQKADAECRYITSPEAWAGSCSLDTHHGSSWELLVDHLVSPFSLSHHLLSALKAPALSRMDTESETPNRDVFASGCPLLLATPIACPGPGC